MNKSEVIQDVAGAAGVGKQDAEKVLDAFFDTVRAAVGAGDKVAWPSFGSFSATDRSARTGRNPRTGEPVAIAASRAMKFTASSVLKADLNPAPAKGANKDAKKPAPAGKAGTAKKATATKAAATKAGKSPAKKATRKTK